MKQLKKQKSIRNSYYKISFKCSIIRFRMFLSHYVYNGQNPNRKFYQNCNQRIYRLELTNIHLFDFFQKSFLTILERMTQTLKYLKYINSLLNIDDEIPGTLNTLLFHYYYYHII